MNDASKPHGKISLWAWMIAISVSSNLPIANSPISFIWKKSLLSPLFVGLWKVTNYLIFVLGIGLNDTICNLAFGSEYIPGWILFMIYTLVIANITAMLLLKKTPQSDVVDTALKMDEKGEEQKKHAQAKDQDKLIEASKPAQIIHYGNYDISLVLKMMDFHCIMWANCYSYCCCFCFHI